MKKIAAEEFRKIALDMLISFADICKNNNLRYSLDYGTLLGAIRHNGFIPWDDDIDVTMPREDYARLMEIAEKNDDIFGKDYRLANVHNRYNVYKPYLNLVNIRTVTISKARKKKYYYPIWIDIFPMDYFDEKDAEQIQSKVERLIWLAREPLYKPHGKSKVLRTVYGVVNRPLVMKRLKRADLISDVKRYSEKLINYMGPYKMRDISYMKYYSNYIYAEFEKHRFRIPSDYDERLKQLYGDYMQLPPEEQRVPHATDAYWEDL